MRQCGFADAEGSTDTAAPTEAEGAATAGSIGTGTENRIEGAATTVCLSGGSTREGSTGDASTGYGNYARPCAATGHYGPSPCCHAGR